MIRNLFKKNILALSLLVFITAFAQVIIPIFNEDRDVFFLSTWHLFSTPKAEYVYDVNCRSDDGKLIYLLRDKNQKALSIGISANFIKDYFSQQTTDAADTQRELYKKKLLIICNSEIRLLKLQLSYFEHYVLKKNGNIVEQEEF